MCRGFSGRGEGIRTPGPMLPKHVRYQTALHPVRVVPTQATLIIIPESGDFVNTFFQKNLKKLKSGFNTGFLGYPTTAGRQWVQRLPAALIPAGQAHVQTAIPAAHRSGEQAPAQEVRFVSIAPGNHNMLFAVNYQYTTCGCCAMLRNPFPRGV